MVAILKILVLLQDYHHIIFFFLSFFGGHMCPILGPLVPLFWISGNVSSGFQSQSGLPYLHCRGKRNACSLRSASGATCADLLAAGLPPVLSPHTVEEVRLSGFKLVLSEYLWVRRSTNWAQPGRANIITQFSQRTLKKIKVPLLFVYIPGSTDAVREQCIQSFVRVSVQVNTRPESHKKFLFIDGATPVLVENTN